MSTDIWKIFHIFNLPILELKGKFVPPIAYREKPWFPVNKSFKSNQRLQFSQGRCRILLGCALQLPHMTRAAQLCWFTTSSNDISDRNPTVGIDTSTLAQVNCKFPYPNLWRLNGRVILMNNKFSYTYGITRWWIFPYIFVAWWIHDGFTTAKVHPWLPSGKLTVRYISYSKSPCYVAG